MTTEDINLHPDEADVRYRPRAARRPAVMSRRVRGEKDQSRTLKFLSEHLPINSASGSMGTSLEDGSDSASIARVAESRSGRIVAAVVASSAVRGSGMGAGNPHERASAAMMAREVLLIGAIAVAPPVQRCGIGSSLIREIADGGRASDASLLSVRFSKNCTGVGKFLRSAGFTLADRPMQLLFADAPSLHVELGDADIGSVWGYQVLQPRRVVVRQA